VLALLLTFLLKPLVSALKRLRIRPPLGAAIVMAAVVGGIGYGAWELAGPALAWMERAPTSLREVDRKLRVLKRPIEKVSKATEQVDRITSVPRADAARQVEIKPAGLRESLAQGAWALLGGAVIVLTLGYFLLASEDFFLEKVVNVLPTLEDKKLAVRIAREIESQVSAYLVTTTLINLGVGVATGLAVWGLGLPNPVLWGVVTWLLNYVPYLGALVNVGLLAVAGLLSFDGVARGLMPAAAFLAINLVEANVVTPSLIGRRLELNPVVVFLGLTFWWWIWGIPGGLLAVPMLATLKLFCDHVTPLAPVGTFLGR
jgi:predicted PurR-regulated permease PerM